VHLLREIREPIEDPLPCSRCTSRFRSRRAVPWSTAGAAMAITEAGSSRSPKPAHRARDAVTDRACRTTRPRCAA